MSTSRTYKMINGTEWDVIAQYEGMWTDRSMRVYLHLPADDIDALSDEELVRYIRELAKIGRYHFALDMANSILATSDQPKSIESDAYERDLAYLLPYANEDQLIAAAIDMLRQQIAYIETRRHAKANKGKQRSQITSQYEKLFVSIGQRDGFHCAKCKATEKLQIDHVKPLAIGGTNDLSNLQFLCATCNHDKGITEVDYRTSGGAK